MNNQEAKLMADAYKSLKEKYNSLAKDKDADPMALNAMGMDLMEMRDKLLEYKSTTASDTEPEGKETDAV